MIKYHCWKIILRRVVETLGEGPNPPRRRLRREGHSATSTRRRPFAECFLSGSRRQYSPSAFSPHPAKKRQSGPSLVRCVSGMCQAFAETSQLTLGEERAPATRQTPCQMVSREHILPSTTLGKGSNLGKGSSHATIWYLEHLFAECHTRQRVRKFADFYC